jgi:hypothetical protein
VSSYALLESRVPRAQRQAPFHPLPYMTQPAGSVGVCEGFLTSSNARRALDNHTGLIGVCLARVEGKEYGHG